MSLADMLDRLNYAEDFDSAHWVDEPDRVLPEDFEGNVVETNTKYLRTYTNDYVYDDLDSVSDFLLSHGYEPWECSLNVFTSEYSAELVTFDSNGYTHGARRDR